MVDEAHPRMRSLTGSAHARRERGQALILFVMSLMVLLGFVALTIDVGLAYVQRRSLQNAVDAAALAAAQDLINGEPLATAEATAIDYVQRHGYTDLANIEVNTPPTSGTYAGISGYVEVAAAAEAPTAFLTLFRGPYTMTARAVAEGKPASETSGLGDPGDPGGSPPPPPANVPNVPCGSPTVDGRVTAGDGYTNIGNLRGGSTDYGDVFYACDGASLYFAMVLNGPSTGGGVANENVYGCSKIAGGKKKPKLGDCAAGDSLTYHTDYATGWAESPAGKHDFGALIKSDRARFQIACDGAVRHDFIQDYLFEGGPGGFSSEAAGDGEVVFAGPTASASSLEWNLEHPADTGWGDDPGEDPTKQSPPFNPLYPDYDSEYDGWIWEMIYEFKVPAAAYDDCTGPIQFGLHDFSGSVGPLEGIHSSPAKTDEGVWLQIEASVLRLVE